MTLAGRLDQALKGAGIQISGVCIGRLEDKTTWKVHPASLQAVSQPIIDAFVMPSSAQLADEEAQKETTRKELKAVALALWECIPNPTMTKAQLQARVIALYKTL